MMRERLIELLRDTFNYTKGVCIDFDEAVEINADHLLANGVIVPRFNNGDIVYHLAHGYAEEERVIFVHYEYITNGYSFYPKDIGKIVFLTREEAEKALKEAQG
jgi:hypothetical protein